MGQSPQNSSPKMEMPSNQTESNEPIKDAVQIAKGAESRREIR